jgi:acetyl-CoA carboxylase biotin carboxylase subunit
VPPFYDSLLAKLIVWDTTRDLAIKRMRRALTELQVEGVKSTRSLHLALLDDPAVVAGDYETGYLEENIGRLVEGMGEAG